MKKKFINCFILLSTALSIKGDCKLPETGQRLLLMMDHSTVVNISLTLLEIRILEVTDLEMELTILLNQKWVDPRVGDTTETRKLSVMGKIWKPEITNLNGNVVETLNSEDTMFWRGFGDGNVFLSEKMKVKFSCSSDYRYFPFDTQICNVKFGSYRFPQDEVTIVWDSNPVDVMANLNFKYFKIVDITTHSELDKRRSGKFSMSTVHFILKRRVDFHIYSVVITILLLTLLNYLAFWLDLENGRFKRFFLNMFIFGVMIFFYYVSVCVICPVSNVKSLGIFVLISKTFSLLTLLETLFIDVMVSLEQPHFHLGKLSPTFNRYSRYILWAEQGMKVLYPSFYFSFIVLYGFSFVA